MKRPTLSELRRSPEVRFEFYRSSGPGGQNVNKVATAVRLRFDVGRSRIIPGEVKTRLVRLAGRRVTTEGLLVVEAQRHRNQERNREDAVRRLLELVTRAWEPPKKRTPTKPTVGSSNRRLGGKRVRGEVKRRRGRVDETGE